MHATAAGRRSAFESRSGHPGRVVSSLPSRQLRVLSAEARFSIRIGQSTEWNFLPPVEEGVFAMIKSQQYCANARGLIEHGLVYYSRKNEHITLQREIFGPREAD